MADATRCSYEDCSKLARSRGWCAYHYNRWIRTGSPTPPPREQRRNRDLWEQVDQNGPGGCWLWLGQRGEKGYGQRTYMGQRWRAHRLFYVLLVGPIPEGLTIDHLCRNTSCVNPAHMEVVTSRENLARSTNPAAIAIRFNTCIRGHSLDGDNVYVRPSRPNSRICRICHREQRRKARARRTA